MVQTSECSELDPDLDDSVTRVSSPDAVTNLVIEPDSRTYRIEIEFFIFHLHREFWN